MIEAHINKKSKILLNKIKLYSLVKNEKYFCHNRSCYNFRFAEEEDLSEYSEDDENPTEPPTPDILGTYLIFVF